MQPFDSANHMNFTASTGTISDELDRLDVLSGKIGLNRSEDAVELLIGMDEVYERLQALDPNASSRKVAETEFDTILSRMQHEANRFLRDLGGTAVLVQHRDQVHPPEDHAWWYLDHYLAQKRQAAMKRSLIIGGIVIVVLLVVGVLYEQFLAPDPETLARYNHEQSAQNDMISGDLDAALIEINHGLQIAPQDGTLLIYRGVIEDHQGQSEAASGDFQTAEQSLGSREDFLVARAQAYLLLSDTDAALADTNEAVQINPQSASAYLISGQVYETMKQYDQAQNAYDQAYTAADQTNQTELAAVARTRMAMLLQMMNASAPELSEFTTPTVP